MYWRPLLINPLIVLAVVAAGALGCHLAGAAWQPRDLAAAAAVSLVSAQAAVLLILRQHRAAVVEVAQAALLALAAHLMLSLVLSAALVLSGQVRTSYVWWAMAMFWATLFGVCAVLIRAVRAAAPAPRQTP